MEFILRKMARYIYITFFLIIFFSPKTVYSGEVTMPTSLTSDTTDFVLLSSSGVTPSISGYNASDIFLVSAVASAGNIKITTTSNTDQAAGYCGYTSDGDSTPVVVLLKFILK